MDQHLFELALLRAMERLIAILLGGVAIVLGYRLFMNVPQSTESSAEADIPGKIKIILTRIGPGVFFALFGAGIVWASYHYQVTVAAKEDMAAMVKADSLKRDSTRQAITQHVAYNGLGMATPDPLNYEEQAGAVRQTLRVLNQLRDLVPANRQPQNFGSAVRASKLSIIRSIWQTDKWGDYAGFDAWVSRGARPPVPTVFEEPYELFQLDDE
jgi:hypothetical protein